jgi:anaerobic magnesium-protoporphyrin IX monomethyl ester cyclase
MTMSREQFVAEIERQKSEPSFERLEFAGTDFSGISIDGLSLQNANLSGCNFSEAQLINCDFMGATLAGSTFYKTNISGSKLRNVELAGADMEKAILVNADLSGAKMSGADLQGADLSNAVIDGTDLTGIDLSTTVMPEGSDNGHGIDVERTHLTSQEGGRKLNILLAMPTWTEDLGGFTRIGKSRNPQVPLGLLYLATLAEDKGHHVEFIDCDVENVTIKALCERVAAKKYDIVGLTATSPIYHKAVTAAEKIKIAYPEVTTIIGGDHVNILKSEVLYETFDFAVVGEAEETWPEFLDAFVSTNDDYAHIDGLIWRRGEEIVENKSRRLYPDLDKLPLPAIHLTQVEDYKMTFATWKNRKVGKYVSIMMSRGCPFKCTFCSESSDVKYGGNVTKMRFRSPKNIVDEMEFHYRTHGVLHFFFMDSNITLKKRHTVELCEEIIKRNIPFTFEGWTRANLINDEMMALLAKAGLVRMSCGVESGDPEILKIIKKEVDLNAIRECFRLMDKYGVEPSCSAMLGNPGETKASVQNTIKFLDSIPELLFTNFSISNPYPGTEMLHWARTGQHGLRLRYDDLSKYSRYDDSPIEVNDLSAKDLVRYQALGLIKIHLKPKRFIAAIRMLGLRNLVPIFIKMSAKVLRKAPETIIVLFPRIRLNRLFHP